jgi:hypothetical protein
MAVKAQCLPGQMQYAWQVAIIRAPSAARLLIDQKRSHCRFFFVHESRGFDHGI